MPPAYLCSVGRFLPSFDPHPVVRYYEPPVPSIPYGSPVAPSADASLLVEAVRARDAGCDLGSSCFVCRGVMAKGGERG